MRINSTETKKPQARRQISVAEEVVEDLNDEAYKSSEGTISLMPFSYGTDATSWAIDFLGTTVLTAEEIDYPERDDYNHVRRAVMEATEQVIEAVKRLSFSAEPKRGTQATP